MVTVMSPRKKLDEEMKHKLRKKAESSLYFFAKGILGFDYFDPSIHLEPCHLLEDPKNTRLMLVLPRGWLKTTLCSCSYPLWRAVKNPNVRYLLTQNTYTNAVSKLGRIKGIVEGNTLFRALWPEILPKAKDTWKSDALRLHRPRVFDEATFEAAGARTQVTSRHYNVIGEDDTVAPEHDDLGLAVVAPSQEEIEKAIGWHKLVPPLLDSPLTDQNLVVGTRWAERDLISWVEKNELFFKKYQRACREGEGRVADAKAPAVYKGRFNDEVLGMIEATLGPYMFSALYMNQPMSGASMVFQSEWFDNAYYDTEPAGLVTYTTVDLAGDPAETKSNPDYNVVLTTGKCLRTGIIYVLDAWRDKCNPGVVINQIFQHVERWHPVKVGIEAMAYQASMQYWVRERMKKQGQYFNVDGIHHGSRKKNVRIQGLQPLVAAGKMKFRVDMQDLITEMLAFPLGANDDLADALAMQLEMWKVTHSGPRKEISHYSHDPLSFEGAMADLKGRFKPRTGFPYDMRPSVGRMSG